jgi:DNA helicase II / ATP-dependent DNA helicase PcrA
MERAEKAKLSPLALAEAICDQKTPDTKPPVKRKLAEFVNCIQTLRALAEAVSPSAFGFVLKVLSHS